MYNETPILYGKEAEKVLREAKTMPSAKSKENGRKLLKEFGDTFDEMIKAGEEFKKALGISDGEVYDLLKR